MCFHLLSLQLTLLVSTTPTTVESHELCVCYVSTSSTKLFPPAITSKSSKCESINIYGNTPTVVEVGWGGEICLKSGKWKNRMPWRDHSKQKNDYFVLLRKCWTFMRNVTTDANPVMLRAIHNKKHNYEDCYKNVYLQLFQSQVAFWVHTKTKTTAAVAVNDITGITFREMQ